MGDLIRSESPALESTLALATPTREALVSWNTRAPRGRLELAASFADGSRSPWLPYVSWDERERRSLGGAGGALELAVDLARASTDFTALHVRGDVALDALWVATPGNARRPAPDALRPPVTGSANPSDLAVPAYSQYPAAHPGERGWCSPTALAMLLAYWGTFTEVPAIAAAVYDSAYAGAGNWAFNVAFAGSLGFAAATAYLDGLAQAGRFIAAGIPIAVSIAWAEGDLPGAPLPASAGHLVVIRGFAADGSVLVNDPAQPGVRVVYPAGAFERVWLGHGGVAYLVAPPERADELCALANA